MCLSGNCSSCSHDRAEERDRNREDTESPLAGPYLTPYERNDTVIIQPVANGGFVVSARSSGYHPDRPVPIIGAFTNREDLLAALQTAF